nr:hypothetical protein [uncultured Roseateles sp.]
MPAHTLHAQPLRRRQVLSGWRRLSLLALSVAALCLGQTMPCAAKDGAELYVIVNNSNPLAKLDRKELIALYTGRSRNFPGAGPAEVFDQPRDSSQREAFYLALTGMDLAQIDSYWARLLFTGRVVPPKMLAGDTALLAEVKRNPRAIAYLSNPPAEGQAKLVMTLSRTN